jgi:hypothetical protein
MLECLLERPKLLRRRREWNRRSWRPDCHRSSLHRDFEAPGRELARGRHGAGGLGRPSGSGWRGEFDGVGDFIFNQLIGDATGKNTIVMVINNRPAM